MKEYKTILTEKNAFYGKIIFNQPEKRNPMTLEMMAEATDAFWEMEKDNKVRVIIFTHKGPVFSAGMPIDYMLNKSYDQILEVSRKHRDFDVLIARDITKPVIAVANGSGVNNAADYADILIASDRSTFSLSAINIGLF